MYNYEKNLYSWAHLSTGDDDQSDMEAEGAGGNDAGSGEEGGEEGEAEEEE